MYCMVTSCVLYTHKSSLLLALLLSREPFKAHVHVHVHIHVHVHAHCVFQCK